MILSDKSIIEYNKKGFLIEGILTPEQVEKQVQPNSFDLLLAGSYRKLKPNAMLTGDEIARKLHDRTFTPDSLYYIDLAKPVEYEEGDFENSYLIMPGEFILMASQEILNIPNGIVSFVQGRSSIARVAIQTEEAGFIDAGFRGTITFEIQNQSSFPIMLYKGLKIAQVYFITAEESERLYGKERGSKYNGQIEATGSLIHLDLVSGSGAKSLLESESDVEIKSVMSRRQIIERIGLDGFIALQMKDFINENRNSFVGPSKLAEIQNDIPLNDREFSVYEVKHEDEHRGTFKYEDAIKYLLEADSEIDLNNQSTLDAFAKFKEDLRKAKCDETATTWYMRGDWTFNFVRVK